MNKVRDLVDLSKVYEAVKTSRVLDPKAKFGTKPGKPTQAIPSMNIKEPLKDKATKNPFFHKDSGPENADGFKKEIVDPKTNKGKENVYEPEKFSHNIEKKVKESINNFMNNKSIFDKLYEEVMGGTEDAEALDAQELGIGPDQEGEKSEAEMSSKELIAKALELLQLAHDKCPSEGGDEHEGSDEFGPEAGKEEGQEDEEDGEEQEEGKKEEKKEDKKEEVAGEAVDAEEVGTPIVDGEKLSKGLNKVSSGSNVVPGDVSTAGKKAGKGGDSKTTDKVGNDGDKGHALVGGGVSGGAPTPVKGKSNVVNSRIKGNNQPFYNV